MVDMNGIKNVNIARYKYTTKANEIKREQKIQIRASGIADKNKIYCPDSLDDIARKEVPDLKDVAKVEIRTWQNGLGDKHYACMDSMNSKCPYDRFCKEYNQNNAIEKSSGMFA